MLNDGVVTLRCLRPEDVAAVLAGEDDEQVRWLNEGHRSEPGRLAAFIARNAQEWDDRGPRRHLGIADAATGELAGTVEAHLALPDLPPGAVNVSYAVFPRWRGRGYAARAVRLLVAWLAEQTDAHTVVLRIDAGNAASLRVARDLGAVAQGSGPDGMLHRHLIIPPRQPPGDVARTSRPGRGDGDAS